MSWIKSIDASKAEGRLKTLYDRIVGPKGQVDNILAAHGLRPHTLEGHMALYKAVCIIMETRWINPSWRLWACGLAV